jgi:hypothetical protein
MMFALFTVAPIGGWLMYPFKTLLFGTLTILIVRRLIEVNYFKEIRLYNDKIVQVWRWGTTEISLANAGLKCVHTRAGNVKIIFDRKEKIYTGWIRFIFFFWKAVSYVEPWFNPEDVKKMNGLIAHL